MRCQSPNERYFYVSPISYLRLIVKSGVLCEQRALVADCDFRAVVGVLGRAGEGRGLARGDAAGGPGDGGRVEEVVLACARDLGREGDARLGEQCAADRQTRPRVLAVRQGGAGQGG